METQQNFDLDLENPPTAEGEEEEEEEEDEEAKNYHSNIDSSRPFRSVKEAVAIFGEKFLAGEIYAPKRFSFPQQETPRYYTPSPSPQQTSWKSFTSPQKSFDSIEQTTSSPMMETLKKLETELEETKMELKLLKERESETEVALASLNAELHKNMSKLARAEAIAASKVLASSRSINSGVEEIGFGEEQRRRDLIVKSLESSTTLAQVLNAGDLNNHRKVKEEELVLGGRMMKKKMGKKKPIIPLVGDLFSRKKGNSTAIHNPLFSSSHLNLN
ncbi:hypothetical protein M9H77_20938 [Catharanthus roseus]|uniref:Uncharacterized protein n=1 Tax=Catharanthus roseus TaxID=4058 RepID=A0ACC0AL53_CATRO|nr:hypothetical protein M9H77_20938 [Catharanthus roseus]